MTKLSRSPASNSGDSAVLATRRKPSCSESAHWLSMKPGTAPLATYSVSVGEPSANRWISVLTDETCRSPASGGSQRSVATYRLSGEL